MIFQLKHCFKAYNFKFSLSLSYSLSKDLSTVVRNWKIFFLQWQASSKWEGICNVMCKTSLILIVAFGYDIFGVYWPSTDDGNLYTINFRAKISLKIWIPRCLNLINTDFIIAIFSSLSPDPSFIIAAFYQIFVFLSPRTPRASPIVSLDITESESRSSPLIPFISSAETTGLRYPFRCFVVYCRASRSSGLSPSTAAAKDEVRLCVFVACVCLCLSAFRRFSLFIFIIVFIFPSFCVCVSLKSIDLFTTLSIY